MEYSTPSRRLYPCRDGAVSAMVAPLVPRPQDTGNAMRDREPEVCEQTLNALLDGELLPAEEAGIWSALEGDPARTRRLARLRGLKHQVREAYRDPPFPSGGMRQPAPRRAVGWAAVATSLLLLGSTIGWYLHPVLEAQRFALIDPDGRGARPATALGGELRIVLHLQEPDQTQVGDLLDEVEAMLLAYHDRRELLRVEVVANGEGLALLRERLTEHRARVRALARRYPNLAFVACQNTIDRLRVERGIEVVLLPEAQLTRSGVNHLVRRQQEGWVYIQV